MEAACLAEPAKRECESKPSAAENVWQAWVPDDKGAELTMHVCAAAGAATSWE